MTGVDAGSVSDGVIFGNGVREQISILDAFIGIPSSTPGSRVTVPRLSVRKISEPAPIRCHGSAVRIGLRSTMATETFNATRLRPPRRVWPSIPDADEPKVSQGDVAAIAATVHETRSRFARRLFTEPNSKTVPCPLHLHLERRELGLYPGRQCATVAT